MMADGAKIGGDVTLISSQRYLHDDIVNEKSKSKDYEVSVSPVFEMNGEKYRAVLDGHHSFHAAMQDEEEPKFVEATKESNDSMHLLDKGNVEDFLELNHAGDDWYDIYSGRNVF